ncbi:STAS/SEC14 domain-containing protein [Simiduia sp. 21SJ11W-1]|uniref:STAS/SEC14 domain-containing protein n=1 Tax=Simiduia sp. 21SJ11W-1 TaxID=2909669 RepID=UPI00209EE2FE|nr:STAS/SEC14 domain-containing protein [Simiduia sp. 21SJ11W-1]UTA47160.1 STAS/SEC14 domain-containing protein [Simiduia sp. 21SJ11W-1]
MSHGFTIGIERHKGRLHLNLRAYGKLTHEDYTQMTPLLEAALAGVPEQSVDVFMDITAFEGWELRAAWDDLKLGLAHGRQFRKIALLGSAGWQSLAATVGNWFVGGEVKYFESRSEACAWLAL